MSRELPVRLPRLFAPADDGAVLASPPLADVRRRLEENRSQFKSVTRHIGSMPLATLRRLAVTEIIAEAKKYHVSTGEPVPGHTAESLLVAGHQPELFHPGVWLKNFALNALASRHDATPLNLVVDNDTVKSTSLRVPVLDLSGAPTGVHVVSLPFDQFVGEVAYEERTVRDERMVGHFPEEVNGRAARSWPFAPILSGFWNNVVQRPSRLLGERLAGARRISERQWGCHNLELPISRLCGTRAFAEFATGLIAELPAFHDTYNAAVRDYRRRNRVRSSNHPVPDLSRDGDWVEAPFWAWRSGINRRGRLYVREVPGGWRLRAGDEAWPDLPRAGAADRWRRLDGEGFKLRTRALTTTLFARLCFADLFLHGIGGGKYDELTDTIIARHFGLAPPSFLVLTGTLRLPFSGYPATDDDERAAWRRVRDIHWNPQRHLPADAEDWRDMMDAKMELAGQSNVNSPRSRFLEMRRLTQRMRERVAPVEKEARRRAETISAETAANQILRRRDYAFCLYPESVLRPFLSQVQSRVLSEPEA
jgi:hypothetical protein